MLPKLALSILWGLAFAAAASTETPQDLGTLSLEELMELEVVAAAKHAQPVFDTAAAVFVLRHEDLLRAGVRNLPEALRLVPGLTVARIDANKWAVSVRGQSSRFNEKLLVMIDGRSIYTPLFSGVFWEAHHLPIDEIERIEVIRGPGGSLWGANAVNGVINILTRTARESEDHRFAITAGTDEPLALDWGRTWKLGPGADLHLWATAGVTGEQDAVTGGPANDDWRRAALGFRSDWGREQDTFSLAGAYNWSDLDGRFELPARTAPFHQRVERSMELSDAHLQVDWWRQLSRGGRLHAGSVLQRERRDELLLDHDLNALGFFLEWQPPARKRHRFTLGLDSRIARAELHGTEYARFDSEHLSTSVASAFIQDQVELAGGRVQLTLGTKLEHHDRTGLNLQPSVRLLARVREGQTLWAAVSSAVRTPSLAESDIDSVWLSTQAGPGGLPVEVRLAGNPNLDTERLLAWELGYRCRLGSDWLVDVALFSNRYNDVISPYLLPVRFEPQPVPRLVQPVTLAQDTEARTEGAELVLQWLPAPRWRISGSYAYLQGRQRSNSPVVFATTRPAIDEPRDVVRLAAAIDLGTRLTLDVQGRYTILDRALPDQSYLGLDLHFGWRLSSSLTLFASGRDLLKSTHQEYNSTEVREPASTFGREVRLSLRFQAVD